MNTTPSPEPAPSKSVATKVGVSCAALALATVSFRGVNGWIKNREVAEAVINERLVALNRASSSGGPSTTESLEHRGFSGDFETRRYEVALTKLTSNRGTLGDQFSDLEGDDARRAASNFAKAAHKLTQGFQSDRDYSDKIGQVREKLKLTLSDEAIKQGLDRMDEMLQGVIQDLNFEPDQEQRSNALVQSFVDYKLTEALLEARRIWGTKSLAEMNSLSAADWQYLSSIVDQRDSVQRAELGMAIAPIFVPYMQQLLLSQPVSSMPNWLVR